MNFSSEVNTLHSYHTWVGLVVGLERRYREEHGEVSEIFDWNHLHRLKSSTCRVRVLIPLGTSQVQVWPLIQYVDLYSSHCKIIGMTGRGRLKHSSSERNLTDFLFLI